MMLHEAPTGRELIVTAARGKGAQSRLLATLGIAAGSRIVVAQRAAFGARVVAIGADRVALAGDACRDIEVRPS